MTYGVVRAFQVIVNTLLLKRLAAAVQLRPWPPFFKGFIETALYLSVRS